MRILVTTPTGNIGSRIVSALQASGHRLTLLARSPGKLSQEVREKVTVVQGELEDEQAIGRALAGVDAAFFLIPPPGPSVTDWRAWQTSIGVRLAAAAKAAGVARVVLLSSTGAQLPDVGPISGIGDAERALNAALPNVVSIRAGYFMENSFGSLATIAAHGAIFGVVEPDRQQQVVATADIAKIAVRWLGDDTWTGQQIAGAHGPTTISPNETAGILSRVLGRPVQYTQIPAPAFRDALLAAGLPSIVAYGYETMMGSMADHLENGDFSNEPQSAESAGTITFEEFARTALLPAFEAQFGASAVVSN